MEKLKESSQIETSDLSSFFDDEEIKQIEFVLAASHSKMPRAMVSRHVYIAAMSTTRLIMWAKRRTLAKSLSEISCSILLEDLKIEDTWSKKGKKSCELLFPDGQLIIIESSDATSLFVENLVNAVVEIAKPLMHDTNEQPIVGEEVFTQDDVAKTHMEAEKIKSSLGSKSSIKKSKPEMEKSAQERSKEVVVTRDVIIQSLSRTLDGSITVEALQKWALKVRDFKVIDADEAMVSYILFSISRIDPQDHDNAKKSIEEYSERLNISLV
jgi:hypothetical protein